MFLEELNISKLTNITIYLEDDDWSIVDFNYIKL